MSKLQLTDNMENIVTKMSEGNPGAMRVIFELDVFDISWVGYMLLLDSMKLYGSHLYMLWNDCCKNDKQKFIKVLKYYKNGKITDKDITERIKNVGYGKSFDDLIGE